MWTSQGKSIRACASAVSPGMGSTFFLIKTPTLMSWLGWEGVLSTRERFSLYKRGLHVNKNIINGNSVLTICWSRSIFTAPRSKDNTRHLMSRGSINRSIVSTFLWNNNLIKHIQHYHLSSTKHLSKKRCQRYFIISRNSNSSFKKPVYNL